MKIPENTQIIAQKKGATSYYVVAGILLAVLIAGIVLMAMGLFEQWLIILIYFGFLLYSAYSFCSAYMLYRKLPDVLIRADREKIYFYHDGEWKSLPLSDVEKLMTDLQAPTRSGNLLSANNFFIGTKDKVAYPVACVDNPVQAKKELELLIKNAN